MNVKLFLTILIILLFFSCSTMYQPSSSDPILTAINNLKTSAKSYHGQHKKILILSWGQPSGINKIDGMEIYQYSHNNLNFSTGTLDVKIDMLIERDTVIGSTVKPSIK